MFNPQNKPEKKNKNFKEKICICGSKQIVNRTHSLCFEHNQIRLYGENWKEIKIKRSKEILYKNEYNIAKNKKASQNTLKQVSDKQKKINSELTKTYKLIDQTREPKCESCGKWFTKAPLSHSHTISVDRCKKIGRPELIYEEENIVLECYEPPTSFPTACHNIWEVGTIQQKMKLITFEKKLNFIKENDQELYKKFLNQINSI